MTRAMKMMTLAATAGAAMALAGGTMLGFAQPTDALAPAPAHASEGTIVRVSGVGRVEVDPNRFSVTLGVRARAATAGEAQQQVNEAMASIIDEVRGLGIEGTLLTTGQISLNPIYERRQRNANGNEEPPKIIGYDAGNTIAVRADEIGRVGEVIDAGIEAGANQAYGVSFMLRETQRAELEALRRAVAAARAKGDAIAQATGQRVEVILEISEPAAQQTPVYRESFAQTRAAFDVAPAAAPTPVETGKVGVSAQVIVTLRLTD